MRIPSLTILAAIASAGGVFLTLTGRLHPNRPVEFCALIIAGVFTASRAAQRSTREDNATMAPSFVIDFTALLLFGANAATLVAAAGAIAEHLNGRFDAKRLPQQILKGIAAVAAIQIAGLVHQSLGGTFATFVWPRQALPLLAAVAAYCLVKIAAAEILQPLLERRCIERAWYRAIRRDCPAYVIGAAIAVGLAVTMEQRAWEILLAASIPIALAFLAYCNHGRDLEGERVHRQIVDSFDEGIAVLDGNGRIALWNGTLERTLDCSRERALGRDVAAAIPQLARTELPRTIGEALSDRCERTLPHVPFTSAAGSRVFEVRITPMPDGLSLRWRDVSEHASSHEALKRHEERLALAAEGANDGWWEWDLRTQEFYCSAKWKAMVGLPAEAGVGRPEVWLDRVHADDLSALKEALKSHLGGKTDRLEHEHRIKHEDGTYRWFLCHGVAKRSGRTTARIAGSMTDTTDRAIAQERLRSAGFRDPLTGLRNRADFLEGIGRRLNEFKMRRGTGRFAVLYLDLDRFKIINDSLGHLVGDEMLIAVSRRLESCLRDADTLARLGGDEFAILLNTVGDEAQANAIAFRIQQSLSEPLKISGREVFTSASIGIAFGHEQHATPDEIMRDADTAMYHAKAHGKARHDLFDADMHARTRDRLDLENDLRHAVQNTAFEVHYQPIVLLSSGMCVGFESLIRWSRNGQAVSPATFVPMAEELGLIEPLGTWVLQQACQTFADWQRRFPDSGLDYITVNVSSRQLMQQNFLSIVEQAVQKAKLKPADLRLEITETALMDSPASAAAVLRQLRQFGARIYLDDFGTGYSSLSHLHKLPVDALKIDRSFVTSLTLSDRPAIVESILALARTLGTSVVAEGIETEVQARELERLGCTHAQGYLFSRPLSATAAEELIAAVRPLGPKRVADEQPPEIDYYAPTPFKWPEHIAPRREGVVEDPVAVGD